MAKTAFSKISFLILVTLVITIALLMYSVDLFLLEEDCTLACLSTIQWIVLASILLGAVGCAGFFVLSPNYFRLMELERGFQDIVWRIFLVVCLLFLILGLNFFLIPSYQPGRGLEPSAWVVYDFIRPLVALIVVYSGSGIVALLILKCTSQVPSQWKLDTLIRVLLSLAAVVFVGEYLLSLIWGAIFYLR